MLQRTSYSDVYCTKGKYLWEASFVCTFQLQNY